MKKCFSSKLGSELDPKEWMLQSFSAIEPEFLMKRTVRNTTGWGWILEGEFASVHSPWMFTTTSAPRVIGGCAMSARIIDYSILKVESLVATHFLLHVVSNTLRNSSTKTNSFLIICSCCMNTTFQPFSPRYLILLLVSIGLKSKHNTTRLAKQQIWFWKLVKEDLERYEYW